MKHGAMCLWLLVAACVPGAGRDASGQAEVTRKGAPGPITTDQRPAGTLLRQWAQEGTAAGNRGDQYDNRDRGHSLLDSAPWPGLGMISYSAQEESAKADWGAAIAYRPGVVFGNSSTSSSATVSGSNTRLLYTSRAYMDLLHEQYRHNNLYVYPSHQDYLPGHDGFGGGYGDLLPANTPYLITSSGSSFSDQPFLKAIAFTLAAFRPEVKQRLVGEGLLMPTMQMIFRMSNKQVVSEADYLAGKAHPAVFDGAQVDVEKMVRLAHAIGMGTLPPLAQVEIEGAENGQAGKDYFDPLPETLANTPGAIARVYRGMSAAKSLIISASGSKDVNGRPLTYHWVLLRGDASRVKITPRGTNGERAEIAIAYHERAAVEGSGGVGSNRVDIALFVHNGVYYSAPAFVTSYSLDSEARTYDSAGRVLEVGYDMGQTVVSVADWGAFCDAYKRQPALSGMQMLLAGLSAEDLTAIGATADEYLASRDRMAGAEKDLADADAAAREATGKVRSDMEQSIRSARDTVEAARRSRDALTTAKRPGMAKSLDEIIRGRLQELAQDPLFYEKHAQTLTATSREAESERQQLRSLGIIGEERGPKLAIHQVEGADRLTKYQLERLMRFNGEVLAGLIAGVKRDTRSNLVDPRLTIPKRWRDVYHYDPQGQMIGWTRFGGGSGGGGGGAKPDDFTAGGELVMEKDALGRPTLARAVQYERRTPASFDPRAGVPDGTPLTYVPTGPWFRYTYRDASDRVGQSRASDASNTR